MRGSIRKLNNGFLSFRQSTRERGLTALLVIEGSLIFVGVPLVGLGALPPIAVPLMFMLMVIAILIVASHSRVAAAVVALAALLSPFGAFVRAEHPSLLTECLSTAGRLLALCTLTWVIAHAVFAGGRITVHRIQGAVLLFLNFALFFFVLYRFIYVLTPHAFNGLPDGGEGEVGAALLYFSFTTLTTAGFGDIAPLHPFARSLASLESVIGMLYPATLLARLVSLELEHRRQSKSERAH